MLVWAPLATVPGGVTGRAAWEPSASLCVTLPFPPPSSGVFEIAEASGVRTGTKIIIHLKSDSREFASEARVRGEGEPRPLGVSVPGLRALLSLVAWACWRGQALFCLPPLSLHAVLLLLCPPRTPP